MLGEQIRKLRKARHISQTDLARHIGVSKQSVSNWESNNIQPSVDVLGRLADFFGCSTDYLLERQADTMILVTSLTDKQVQEVTAIIREMEQLNQQVADKNS